MKIYRGSEGIDWSSSFRRSTWRYRASVRPYRFTSWETNFRYGLLRTWSGTQGRSGHGQKEEDACPCR